MTAIARRIIDHSGEVSRKKLLTKNGHKRHKLRELLCFFVAFLRDDALAAEELLERRIDVVLVVDPHADKALLVLQTVVENRQQRARASAITGCSLLSNLSISEQIAGLDQLVGKLHSLVVVRIVVISIREMERIDVPVARWESLGNDVERQLVCGTDNSPARFALRKECLLGYFVSLGMMADEDDSNLIVFRAQKADHPEIEAPRDILLELTHRPADVHERQDNSIRLVSFVLFPALEPQILLLESSQ